MRRPTVRFSVLGALVAVFALAVSGTVPGIAAEQTIGGRVLPTLGVDLSAPAGERVSANTRWTATTERRGGLTIITVVAR